MNTEHLQRRWDLHPRTTWDQVMSLASLTTSLLHNVKKTYGYGLSGILLILCRRLIFTYPLIGTSQSASHTIRQHREQQYSMRQWYCIDIVTYLSLHSSQCVPLRQMYPRFHIYAYIVGLCVSFLLSKYSLGIFIEITKCFSQRMTIGT